MDISNLTMSNSTTATVSNGIDDGRNSRKTAVLSRSVSGSDLPKVSQKAPDAQTENSPLTSEDLGKLVEKVNESFSARSSNLKFSVVEGTNISVVRVEDAETGELIRQFPSEEMIAFAKTMDELKQGTMLEERV